MPFRGRGAFTLVELLVVMAIVGLLVGLLLPAIQAARGAALCANCVNNLKQLSLACLNFESANGKLPPGEYKIEDKTKSPELKNEHGWAGFILPYIEQKGLHSQYDTSLDWTHPQNLPIVSTPLAIFRCPATSPDNRVDSFIEYENNDPNSGIKKQYSAACGDYFACKGVKGKDLSDPSKAGCKDSSGNWIPCLSAPPGYPPGGSDDDVDAWWVGAFGKIEFKVDKNPSKNKSVNGVVRLKMIKDGLSNTLLLSECAGRPEFLRRGQPFTKYKDNTPSKGLDVNKGGGWASKENCLEIPGCQEDGTVDTKGTGEERKGGPLVVNVTNEKNIYSFHHGGSNAAFADGSVRFFSVDINLRTVAALATRAGGEATPVLD